MDLVMGWQQWFFVAVIAIGTIVRMAKATGWRPDVDTTGNGAYAFSVIAFPALWFYVLYSGGFF